MSSWRQRFKWTVYALLFCDFIVYFIQDAQSWLERFEGALDVLILATAIYWGTKEQYFYLWDELIWILGFLIIDWNIHDWRSWRRTVLGRPLSASPPAA